VLSYTKVGGMIGMEKFKKKIEEKISEHDDLTILLRHRGIWTTADDIRQYMYCPRIIYFKYVLHIKAPRTFRMERGSQLHERKIRQYHVEQDGEKERYFNIWLRSPTLGFVTLLDAFEIDEEKGIYPVEYKTGKIPRDEPRFSHLMQVTTQAMLLEKVFDVEVMFAKLIYIDESKEFFVDIQLEHRKKVCKILREIKKIIDQESIPDPNPNTKKCTDCDYWQQCMRI